MWSPSHFRGKSTSSKLASATSRFSCAAKVSGSRRQLPISRPKDARITPMPALSTPRGMVRSFSNFASSTVQQMPPRPRRIVVGITGATGAPYAISMLRVLRDLGVETHVVISKWALATLKYETTMTEREIRELAYASYTAKDVSAPIASGSFQHDGMVIVPCSMKTLAAVRSGYCDDLISRAADVTMKEDRRLLMVVRETPLSVVHLDNMLFLRRAGAIIFPPMPAFYTRPESLEDVVNQGVGRMLDLMGIHTDGFERWNGFKRSESGPRSVAVGT